MKKFTFSLESLLSLRDWEEQSAKLALGQATSKVEQIKAMLQALSERVDSAYSDWMTAGAESFRPGDRMALKSQIAQFEQRRRDVEGELKHAEANREKAMKSLQEASRQKGVVTNLKEKRFAEYKAEVEKQEALEIEDVFNARRSVV